MIKTDNISTYGEYPAVPEKYSKYVPYFDKFIKLYMAIYACPVGARIYHDGVAQEFIIKGTIFKYGLTNNEITNQLIFSGRGLSQGWRDVVSMFNEILPFVYIVNVVVEGNSLKIIYNYK